MAPEKVQYQHYIPRFILKQFEHTRAKDRKGIEHGIVHFFDLTSQQFWLKEVAKCCGTQNLYYNASDADTDPMRIEHLFSKLESKTSMTFSKIKDAVTNNVGYIDILEKEVHHLFQFMNLSLRRSEWYRDEVKNPHRENDFFFQRQFEISKQNCGSGDPEQFWLDQLLYLLETSHDDILEDAKNADQNPAAYTYRYFVENYTLQIWKAASGYEFFLNERLVDFEGDTESRLGAEVIRTKMEGERYQLAWMTSEDIIHLVLPISPDVALVFCNESRCWESPFVEILHRAKIPYPENSLLKNAPHKDILSVHIPSQRRGKKKWPATVAWRVNIGTLAQEQHRIIASYSLSHARSLIVVRSRAQFERARRELELFSQERMEHWSNLGVRFTGTDSQQKSQGQVLHPLEENKTEALVDEVMSILAPVFDIIFVTHEVPPITKANAFKFWMAICTLKKLYGTTPPSAESENCSTDCIINPGFRAAFEAAYPPKDSDHRDLNNVTFSKFFDHCIGEETFRLLFLQMEKKFSELCSADTFRTDSDTWEATSLQSEKNPPFQQQGHDASGSSQFTEDMLRSTHFKSIVKAAHIFDMLKWMFHERQDILATFIRQIAVPLENTKPRVLRFRQRRE